MRSALCDAMVRLADRPDFVFLTGDLGYNALEPLQAAAGSRFINAGLAEQNMVAVAAGLARAGLRPWVYSIAPFLYARPYEQIRNDVCLHNLPVMLVGNGGGYGYGVMGGTHHALEDYGALLCLQQMSAYVPAFRTDIPAVVALMTGLDHPAYLRLGYCEKPQGYTAPPFAAWRKLADGSAGTLVVVGPLAGPLLGATLQIEPDLRPACWSLSELPVMHDALPSELLSDIEKFGRLAVVEEHVAHGGAGEMLARALLLLGRPPRSFLHLHARGYPSHTFGSQSFHRTESGLDADSILASFRQSPTLC